MKFKIISIALVINSFLIPATQADTILGIHAREWHAWLSVTTDGTTHTYGLWPDKKAGKNGRGHDIRKNFREDALGRAAASRYYQLTPQQIQTLNGRLNQNLTWGVFKNCAWWASKVVYEVVGEDVDANRWLGIPDPEEVCDNIKELEARNDTSHLRPSGAPRRSHKSCSSGSSSSSSSSSSSW